jgi:hypothetical protein
MSEVAMIKSHKKEAVPVEDAEDEADCALDKVE